MDIRPIRLYIIIQHTYQLGFSPISIFIIIYIVFSKPIIDHLKIYGLSGNISGSPFNLFYKTKFTNQ